MTIKYITGIKTVHMQKNFTNMPVSVISWNLLQKFFSPECFSQKTNIWHNGHAFQKIQQKIPKPACTWPALSTVQWPQPFFLETPSSRVILSWPCCKTDASILSRNGSPETNLSNNHTYNFVIVSSLRLWGFLWLCQIFWPM